MAAFDALPPAVRRVIAFYGFRYDASIALAALQSGEREGVVVARIRRTEQKFIDIDNRLWRDRYGVQMPHVAAGATILVTEPMAEPATVERRRRRVLG